MSSSVAVEPELNREKSVVICGQPLQGSNQQHLCLHLLTDFKAACLLDNIAVLPVQGVSWYTQCAQRSHSAHITFAARVRLCVTKFKECSPIVQSCLDAEELMMHCVDQKLKQAMDETKDETATAPLFTPCF